MQRALLLLTLLLAGLAACSKIKVGYRFADWALHSQVRKYVQLTAPQDELLKADIESYLRWHRTQMLPAYAKGLKRLAEAVEQDGGSEAAALAGPLLTKLYEDTVEPTILPTARLLLSLGPRQLEELEKSFAAKQAKDRGRFLADPAKALEARQQRTLRFVQDWAGTLSTAQAGAVRARTAELRTATAAWLEERGRKQAELLALLRRRAAGSEVAAHLKQWWTRSRMAEEEREEWQLDEAEVRDYVKAVLAVLRKDQKAYFASKLRTMAEDCEDLSVEPVAGGLKPPSEVPEPAGIRPKLQPRPTAAVPTLPRTP